jgi:hypothetical protein
MPGYSLIKHQGKEILYVDYTGMTVEEVLNTIDEVTEFALKENRPLLRLSNVTGVYAIKEVVERAQQSGKRTNHLTIKRAAVGVTGAKKILLNTFNRVTGNNLKAFSTEEEAKAWLVK